MLKKTMITAAAVLALATGATALQSKPAEAGITIQLGNGWGPGYFGGYHGPRYGFYGPHRQRCFTRTKTVKVKKWNPRRHRMVVKYVKRPVRVCR